MPNQKKDPESVIVEVLSKGDLSSEDLASIGYCLGLVLTRVLSETDKGDGMQNWSVDDMVVYTHAESKDKLTTQGKIYWLSGGSSCVSYQVDISKSTSTLLYSYKLKDKHSRQQLYVGKSLDGWTVK